MKNMKAQKAKKGFTIVELVIVIAVIGVLTAILVPTFINLSSKANKASDNALITNLNKTLAAAESEAGEKPATMHEAVQSLEKYGYDVSQIVNKSEEKILWNSNSNRFFLEGDIAKQTGEKVDFWKIQTSYNSTDTQKYSIYAGKDFAKKEITGLKVGFDVGYNEISKVEYVGIGSRQVVTLRTDGGALQIDAPYDDLYHYGLANNVKVVRIASSSYHERGEVPGLLELQQGNVEIETQNDYTLYLNTNDLDNVSFTTSQGEVELLAADSIKAEVEATYPEMEVISADEPEFNVKDFKELKGKVASSEAGVISDVTLNLVSDNYYFEERIDITKSISIVGKSTYSTLVGYPNPECKDDAGAFSITVKDEAQVYNFENLKFDCFAIYADEARTTFVNEKMYSNTGIEMWGFKNEDVTNAHVPAKLNVNHCYFQGAGGNFLKVWGGELNATDSKFVATQYITNSTNSIQVGSAAAYAEHPEFYRAEKTTLNVSGCEFRDSRHREGYGYSSSGIYGFGDIEVILIEETGFYNCEMTIFLDQWGYGYELVGDENSFKHITIDDECDYWPYLWRYYNATHPIPGGTTGYSKDGNDYYKDAVNAYGDEICIYYEKR